MKKLKALALVGILTVAGTVATHAQNLIANGDFTANAAAFTNDLGYLNPQDAGNPTGITGWSLLYSQPPTMWHYYGLNGAATGLLADYHKNYWGPTYPGGRTYMFVYPGGAVASQNLALTANKTYWLDFDVAEMKGGGAIHYQVDIKGNSQTYYNSGSVQANTTNFVHVSATFTTPATLNGTLVIELKNIDGGYAYSVVFANVTLVAAHPSVAVSSPANSQNIFVCSSNSATVSATASVVQGTGPCSVTYFYKLTNNPVYTATAAVGPFGATNTFAQTLGALPVGVYQIYATVTDSAAGTATSVTNTFTVAVFTVAPPSVKAKMLIDEQFVYAGPSDGTFAGTHELLSGWQADTTGGYYVAPVDENLCVIDTSTTGGVTLNHPFLSQTSGTVTFETWFAVDYTGWMGQPSNLEAYGITWQLRGAGDAPAVKLMTSGGNLCYEDAANNLVPLQSYAALTHYGLKVVANVDTQTADIYVSGVLRASGVAFRYPVGDLESLYFQSSDAGTGYIFVGPVKVYVSYEVWDKFIGGITWSANDWTAVTIFGTVAVQPWLTCGLIEQNSVQLNDTSPSGTVTLSHPLPVQTTPVVFEYTFIQPTNGNSWAAALMGGSTPAVSVVTSNNNICYTSSSGALVPIWTNYRSNVWYTVRIIANPATATADIYINGKQQAGGVAFQNAVAWLDRIQFNGGGATTGTMWVDDVLVYAPAPLPADYVPVPVPCGSPNYILGMQTFAGWRVGHHLAWDWCYRFTDHDLYMGWYDEGAPEASDWQLKFMAEHGITYFIEDWGGATATNPIKPDNVQNLEDGYFYAQYSSLVKFAIAEWSGIYPSSQFRNNIVPYWMEHYFRDSRYLTISNQVVVALANWPQWETSLVTGAGITNATQAQMNAAVKAETDFLRQQCVNAGFAGAYLMTSYQGTDPTVINNLAAMGYDYIYQYSTDNQIAAQETRLNAQKAVKPGMVLTAVGVGYNTIAADGDPKYDAGYVSTNDFQTLCNWARNTFMPSLSAGSLGHQMVMLDNWNEYNEGHFINPGVRAGFGYLDALRTTFTTNPAHSDLVPSSSQVARISVLFPRGWNGRSWNFDMVYPGHTNTMEGWDTFVSGIGGLGVVGGYLNGTITNNDPMILCRDHEGINLSGSKFIKVRLKNRSANTTAHFYFITTTDAVWNEAKSKSFPIVANDSQYTEYLVDMSNLAGWTGTLRQLRFDPVDSQITSGSFSIDYIRLSDPTTYGTTANLAWNGNFDSGTLNPWTPSSGATWNVDLTCGLNGTPAAMVSGVVTNSVIMQVIPVASGRRYVVECWTKGSAADQAWLGAWGRDVNGNSLANDYHQAAQYGTGGWNLLQLFYEPPTNAASMYLMVGTFAGAVNPVYFDAIQISELPNSVLNGDFTGGNLNYWSPSTSGGGAAWSVNATGGRYGTPTAMVTNVGSDTVQSQMVPVLPGRQYTISVWAQGSSLSDPLRLIIQGADSNGVAVSGEGQEVDANGTDWGQITISYTPPAGVKNLWVEFGTYGTTGPVYFDDLTCVESPNFNATPATTPPDYMSFNIPTVGIASAQLVSPATLLIQWPALGSRYRYTLEESAELSPANWQPVTGTNVWPIPQTQATVTLGAGNRFFRVKAKLF